MGMFDDLVPAQQAEQGAAGGLFDDLIPAAPTPAAVDTKKFPHSADDYPYDENSFVKERKIVNGKEYRLHQPTGAIYGPDDKATDDPDVMAAFGKAKLSKRGQARADIRKPQQDFSVASVLDDAISQVPGIGQQYGAAKWAIQTGKEIADTPQETTDAIAQAAQTPDQSSLATDWQAGTANAKAAYLGQQIIGLRTELNNLSRIAKERPNDPLIKQRLARTEAAYQRVYQMYDEASGQQSPQNPAFAALHDPNVPGTPAQKTAAAFRADPWGVARTLAVQSGPVSIPSVAGGIIGSIAAGRAGAALGAGIPSAYIEAGLNLRDQIASRGADMNDPASRRATFEKHADEIIRDARISGLIVGSGDAAGAAFGSGVAALKGQGAPNLVGKELVGTIADALFGAAGEGGKQIYNTGEISDPQALYDEGLGEVVAGGVQQGGMMAVEGLKSATGKTDRQKPPPQGQRIEPRLFDDLVPQAQQRTPEHTEQNRTNVRPVQDPMAETDILRQTGYSLEQIADMNPAERAQAAQEARQQGIEPIGTIAPGAPPVGTSATAPGFGTRKQRASVQTEQDMAAVRPVVNAQPSEAQAAAGNYQKGHINLHGLDISIENPKGSVRRGTDPDTGKAWQSPSLPADYGYVKGTKGKDGDHVDVYIGPNPQSDRVYVIDQVNLKDGTFDEHKAVLAANSPQEAVDLYVNSFDVPTLDRIGDVTEMSVDEFKAWSKNGRATKRPAGQIPQQIQPDRFKATEQAPVEPVDTAQSLATADKAFDSYMASRKPLTPEGFAAASGLDVKAAGRAIQRAALAGRVIQTRSGKWVRAPQRSTPINAVEFIASLGGIQDATGELKGMDLPKMTPYGPVVRKNGLHPDKVREALVEAGYLQDAGRDTGGQAQTTVDDVYQLLDAHMRGQKAYSVQDQAWADDVAATKRNEQIDPEWRPIHPVAQIHGLETWEKVQAFFADSGTSEETWSPQEVSDAARLVAEGMDAGDAFERAAFLQIEERSNPIDPEAEFPEVIEWMRARDQYAMELFGDMPPFPDVEQPRAAQPEAVEEESNGGAQPVQQAGSEPADQADAAGDRAEDAGTGEVRSEETGQDGAAVEPGADNLPQTVIPGAEAVSEADAAKAAKAEKARKELEARRKQSKLRKSGQESVEDQDGGLFGGKGPKQSSLLDEAPKTKEADTPTEGNITVDGIEFTLRNRPEAQSFFADLKTYISSRFMTVAKMAEAEGGRYNRPTKTFVFESQEARQRFLNRVEKGDVPAAAATTEGTPSITAGHTFTTAETTHAKTGERLFVATINTRVGPEEYARVLAVAKKHGGWYSSFKGRGAIPGFQFKSEDGRIQFLAETGQRPQAPLSSRRLSSAVPDRPIFYSGLLRAVESLKQDKAPAAQWLGTIRNTPGVKPEEVAWLGLDDWLSSQTGTVTKAQIADFVRANQVQVSEVEKGRAPAHLDQEHQRLVDERSRLAAEYEDLSAIGAPTDELVDRMNDLHDRIRDIEETETPAPKFEQYQLPGGENYRELLLTLSTKPTAAEKDRQSLNDQIASFSKELREKYGPAWRADQMTEEEYQDWRDLHAMHELAADTSENESRANQYHSGHWSESNVVAHVRFNERTVDGQKVLFIEEIQSDWHQAGRKKGYRATSAKTDTTGWTVVRQKNHPIYGDTLIVSDADGNDVEYNGDTSLTDQAAIDQAAYAEEFRNSWRVPDAPFKTTWPELAMKRMVRWAAQNGFDRIAWTPGDVQAERYDLSKQIDAIQYMKVGNDLYNLSVVEKGGRSPRGMGEHTGAQLVDQIGKEMADKIVNGEGRGLHGEDSATRVIDGLDLKVGGEGMKGFYDKILVDTARKLGKKFGASVGRTNIQALSFDNYTIEPNTGGRWNIIDTRNGQRVGDQSFRSGGDAESWLNENLGTQAHSLDITPAMRAAVMEGQPLFRIRPNKFRYAISDKQRRAVVADVQEAAQRILGHHLQKVMTALDLAPLGFSSDEDGVFDPNTGAIYVALQGAQDPRSTIRHEAIHALRQAGVFTKPEWAALSRMAASQWIDRYNIRDRYEQLYRERFDLTDAQIEELLTEEAVADAFADYMDNPRGEDVIARIFEKLRRFLEAVRSALKGQGFTTASQVFGDVDRGVMGGRDAGTGTSREFMLYGRQGSQGPLSSRGRQAPPRNPAQGSFQPLHEQPMEAWRDDTLRYWGAGQKIDQAIRAAGQERYVLLKDRHVAISRMVEAAERAIGRKLPDHMDPFLASRLFAGRMPEAVRQFEENEVQPLVAAMAERRITPEELGQWLSAHHAEERNMHLGQYFKPGDPFHDAITDPTQIGASGWSTDQAIEVKQRFAHRAKAFGHVAEMVYRMQDQALDLRLRAGLIDQATHDRLHRDGSNAVYQFYVPQQGFEAEPDNAEFIPGVGAGFDLRSPEFIRAIGRRSRADNPLAYIVSSAKKGIIRAEKARVDRSLMLFIQNFPNPDLYELNKVNMKRAFSTDAQGNVTIENARDRSADHDDNVLVVKIGGKSYRITFSSTPAGNKLARAFKNLEAAQLGTFTAFMHKAVRMWAQLNTSRDPQFLLKNFNIDTITALINVSSESPKDRKARVASSMVRSVGSAIRGMNRHLQGKHDTEWSRHAKEFAANGGKMEFLGLMGIEAEKKMFDRTYRQQTERLPMTKRMAYDFTIGRLERWNDALENAWRLSAYVALRNNGVSANRAAQAARDLTVDFAVHGEKGPMINAFYAFFNATAEGQINLVKRYVYNKYTRRIMNGLILMGFMQTLLNYWIAGDDDDGEDKYQKIPDFVKLNNFVFVVPEFVPEQYRPQSGYVTYPARGWNIFHVIGQMAAETVVGGRTPEEAAAIAGTAMLEFANPMGSSGSLLNIMAPTFIDPIVDIENNKNFMGQQIVPDYGVFDKRPDSEKYRETTSEAFRAPAQLLNEQTGGSDTRPGKISISPETLEHWYEFATGGLGRLLSRSWNTIENFSVDEPLDPEKLPFARLYLGQDKSFEERNVYYEIRDKVDVTKRELDARKDDGDTDEESRVARTYAREVSMIKVVTDAERDMAKLRKERKAIKGNQQMGAKAKREAIEAVDMEMDAIMLYVRKQWNTWTPPEEAVQ